MIVTTPSSKTRMLWALPRHFEPVRVHTHTHTHTHTLVLFHTHSDIHYVRRSGKFHPHPSLFISSKLATQSKDQYIAILKDNICSSKWLIWLVCREPLL